MHDRGGRVRAATLAIAFVLAPAACSPSPVALPSAPSIATQSSAPTVLPSSAATVAPATERVTAPPGTGSGGAAACEPLDLKASHGLVEGAAGSTFTTVVLSPGIDCSIDLYPAFGLKDANGAVLVGGAAAGPGRIDLDSDLTYESNVQLGNWCGDTPKFPPRFELLLGGAEVEVTGSSFPEPGNLPPCNGSTQGPVLEASAWAAQ